MKMYKSCNRLVLRTFCLTGCLTKMNDVDFTSNAEQLCVIIKKYQEYRTRWEKSANQPSRMVALFLKLMRSYLRCCHAVTTHDGWLLDIESWNLLPIWKMNGKTTYLRLQSKFMENFYNILKVPLIYREIMRANNFCVKPSGRMVEFDEENKNYNNILKRSPTMPSLDVAIIRSRHVMIGTKASKEMWGLPQKQSRIWGTSLEDDVLELERTLHLCDLFVSHQPILIFFEM